MEAVLAVVILLAAAVPFAAFIAAWVGLSRIADLQRRLSLIEAVLARRGHEEVPIPTAQGIAVPPTTQAPTGSGPRPSSPPSVAETGRHVNVGAASPPAQVPLQGASAGDPAGAGEVRGPTVGSTSGPPPSPPTEVTSESAGSGPPPLSLEERIGVTWFTRVGAAVLVLGALYFFKYAVDNQWIGPWGRVALGLAAGVSVLIVAEWQSGKARPAWVQGLLGVGLAILYVSSYAAYGFYTLLPLPVAFAALAVVASLGGALALRHDSQVILVIALLAALANPLLLSTGEDRPVALFTYLVLVSAAAAWVAFRLRSHLVVALAVAGPAVLAVGWYSNFFDTAPPLVDPVSRAAVPGSAGAYWALAPRLGPLAFVVVFAVYWIALGRVARRQAWEEARPLGLVVAGVLLAHLGGAALLLDRPELLAGAMLLCAVGSSVVLRREAEPGLLVLPLGASFLLLAGRAELAREAPTVTLLLAAGWLVTWGFALVLRTRQAAIGEPSRRTWGLTAAIPVLGVVVAALLLPDRPELLAGSMLGLGVVVAALVWWSGRAWLGAGSVGAAVVALLLGVPRGENVDVVFLAIAGAWALVYLGVGTAHVVSRGRETNPWLVVTTSAAPLCFVALVLLGTGPQHGGARALCAVGAGLPLFLLGVAVLRRRQEERGVATALLAEGLGLAALAVALAFSGVTITLVWAIGACAVALIAARAGDRGWLAGALLLFGLVIGRVIFVDAAAPGRQYLEFVASRGAAGVLVPTPLLNARALALAGVALALTVAARGLARRGGPGGWARAAAALGIVAHTMLLALVVTEVRGALTRTPMVPPGALGIEEFQAFMAKVSAVLATQQSRLGVASTLATGGYGAMVLTLGFAARSALNRWTGLVVLGLTVLKLALWDVWNLPRLYQILVLVVVGVLLLGSGFLYARFGRRLLGLLGGSTLLLTLALAPGAAWAVEVERFAFRAEVHGAGAGLAVFEVPLELYRASASGPGLEDMRIAGADGAEVPWLLRDVSPPQVPRELPVVLLDPVTLPDGSSAATFDMGPNAQRHSELVLDLAGEEFLRHVVVEVSEDRHSWATLGESVVFRVAVAPSAVTETSVRYPLSTARFVRVRLAGVPGESPVVVTGGVVRLGPEPVREPTRLIPLVVVGSSRDESERRTILDLDAGAAGVPLRALVVEVETPRFERRVQVQATERPGLWSPVGGGVLHRDPSGEGVRLQVASSKRYFRLIIDDRDDRPLAIAGVSGESRRQEVVLEVPARGRCELLIGREGVRPPSYDLAATVQRSPRGELSRATLSSVTANPRFRAPTPPLAPWTERHRVAIAAALAVLLLVLAMWTFRLLRQG